MSDVGFGVGGDVAGFGGTAHHHDLSDLRGQLRIFLQRQRDIGQRCDCDQHEFAGAFFCDLRDLVPGAQRIGRSGTVGDLRVRQAVVAVMLPDGFLEGFLQVALRAHGDRDLLFEEMHDIDGIGGRDFRVVVAAHGGDGFEIKDITVAEAEGQAEEIVDAGVGVDDDRDLFHIVSFQKEKDVLSLCIAVILPR